MTFFADSNDTGKAFHSVAGTITIAPIPEPSTLTLLGVGAWVVLAWGRRRRVPSAGPDLDGNGRLAR